MVLSLNWMCLRLDLDFVECGLCGFLRVGLYYSKRIFIWLGARRWSSDCL